MPNWCYQYCTVEGPKEDLKSFIKALEFPTGDGGSIYGMNHLFECPEELSNTVAGRLDGDEQVELEKKQAENMEKYGYENWYDWCVAKWGTKWGAVNLQIENNIESHGNISMQFESAWAPAIGLLEEVSRQFPTLAIGMYCREEANFFAGYGVFKGGETIIEDGVDLSDAPEPPEGDIEAEWDVWAEKHSEWNSQIDDKLASIVDKEMSELRNSTL